MLDKAAPCCCPAWQVPVHGSKDCSSKCTCTHAPDAVTALQEAKVSPGGIGAKQGEGNHPQRAPQQHRAAHHDCGKQRRQVLQ